MNLNQQLSAELTKVAKAITSHPDLKLTSKDGISFVFSSPNRWSVWATCKISGLGEPEDLQAMGKSAAEAVHNFVDGLDEQVKGLRELLGRTKRPPKRERRFRLYAFPTGKIPAAWQLDGADKPVEVGVLENGAGWVAGDGDLLGREELKSTAQAFAEGRSRLRFRAVDVKSGEEVDVE